MLTLGRMMVHASSSSLQRPLLRMNKATTLKKWFTRQRATAIIPPPPNRGDFDEATKKTTKNAKKRGDVHPLSFSGCKLCANFAMVSLGLWGPRLFRRDRAAEYGDAWSIWPGVRRRERSGTFETNRAEHVHDRRGRKRQTNVARLRLTTTTTP